MVHTWVGRGSGRVQGPSVGLAQQGLPGRLARLRSCQYLPALKYGYTMHILISMLARSYGNPNVTKLIKEQSCKFKGPKVKLASNQALPLCAQI